MFFQDRIKNIKETDNVLEIGPGADPHPRSNVLLEMQFDDPHEYEKQFGHDQPLVTSKPVIFYDGKKFPFKDNEFDYVICSHVLEHVDDIELFLSEVFRVAKKGYFEFPKIAYEYLYNIDAHLNYLRFEDNTLFYLKKNKTHLNEFAPIQAFLLESLRQGHSTIINDLMPSFIEGFEWNQPFRASQVQTVDEVFYKNSIANIETKKVVVPRHSTLGYLKMFLLSLLGRVK